MGLFIFRMYGGIGIGFSISKCLVGLMKGEIGFLSIFKVGFMFMFIVVFVNGVYLIERKSELYNNN